MPEGAGNIATTPAFALGVTAASSPGSSTSPSACHGFAGA
jgi:hypothetical protein